MNRYTLAAQQIKDSISAQDLGAALGWEIRRGRCRCPVHGGGDFNCVLYRGTRGWYCHVCHKGGDVISLAMEYHGMSFKDAVTWFNDAFHLGMDIESPMSPEALREASERQEKRAMENALKEKLARLRFDMFLKLDIVAEDLEELRDMSAPKSPDEEWKDEFAEAVIAIPVARRMADDQMMYCIEKKE